MNIEHPSSARPASMSTSASAPIPVASPGSKGSLAKRITIGLIVVALLAGLFVLSRARSRAAEAAAAAAAKAAADRPIPVLTSSVAQRDVPVWLEGLGNAAAFYTVTIKTQVDGRIDQVLFNEGDHVKKGQVLIQIDPRPYAIQLQSAQAALQRDSAQLQNGQLNLDRYKTLSAQNLIAVQQYTDQKATVDQYGAQIATDQAQINAAKLNLDYARITSPIDGVVGIRLVDPGNVVHAADTTGLVVVTQLDPIAVFFTLPEDDLVQIQQVMTTGPMEVEARSRDGDVLLGTGKLAVIDNEINQATATARLKAVFDNPKQTLWPNEFVKARLKLRTLSRAIVIPLVAVQHGPQGTFAYVAGSDGTATMRPVTLGTTQGDLAVISNGLEPGEDVVVEGQAQLKPGARVSAKPAPTQTGAAAGASSSSSPEHHRTRP